MGVDNKQPLIMAVTNPARDPKLPNVPTIGELGAPHLAIGGNFTFVARAGTPEAAINRMSDAVAQALKQDVVQQQLTRLGIITLVRTPDQLKKTQAELNTTFRDIAKRIDLQPE